MDCATAYRWPALLSIVTLLTVTAAHAQSKDSLPLRMPSLTRVTRPASAVRPPSHVSVESKVDRPVRVRYCPEPVYPSALARYGFAGDVVLVFVVDTSGRAEINDLVVSEFSHPGFVQSARRIIAKCRFDPAVKSGRPVRYLVQQRIRFRQGPRPE
jgi:TonB family protein